MEAAGRAEMHMHIDQPWQQRLTCSFDRLRIQRLCVGRGAFVNLRNLSLPNKNRTGLDYLAVADENARILDQ